MGYVGSYVWQLRQKVGQKLLLTITVDVLAIDEKGQIRLVKPFGLEKYTTPGGHAEVGDSFSTAAVNELAEETGLVTKPELLTPYAAMSGKNRVFQYPDGKTQPFTMAFFTNEWVEDQSRRDDEIENIKLFNINQALESEEVDDYTKKIIRAYNKYQQTNQFQMIEEF